MSNPASLAAIRLLAMWLHSFDGLAAVGNRKLLRPITAGHIFWTSMAMGRKVRGIEDAAGRRFTRLRLAQPQKSQLRTLPKILGTDFHGS